MALKEKSDIKQMTLEIDRRIYNRVNIKNKKFFGLASRLKDSSGKVLNFSDLHRSVEDGEISFYDDRYNLVWFHRIDSISFEKKKGVYGRSSLSQIGRASGVSVFWAKRASMNLQNERFDLYQYDLLSYLLNALSDVEEYEIQKVDFDIQNIENQEFSAKKLHKESLLLKFDFLLHFQPNICSDACTEWDCCDL